MYLTLSVLLLNIISYAKMLTSISYSLQWTEILKVYRVWLVARAKSRYSEWIQSRDNEDHVAWSSGLERSWSQLMSNTLNRSYLQSHVS
mgnify:CR=1 FL=1